MLHNRGQNNLDGKPLNLPVSSDDYVTEELCTARREGLVKDCMFHSERIRALERKQDSIDRKITATLVSVIVSLATVIVFWLFGVNI